MAAYSAVLDLEVRHDFFNQGVCRHLRFEPSASTTEWLLRHQVLTRQEENHLLLLSTSESANSDFFEATVLRYFVFSSDPLFGLYTAQLDRKSGLPLYFESTATDVDGLMVQSYSSVPVEEQHSSSDALPRGQRTLVGPRLIVDIPVTANDFLAEDAAKSRHKRIHLQANSMFWKYYFFGEFTKKAIEISDLNTTATPVEFEASDMSVARQGVAWVSKVAIPMQEVPTQRFQLRAVEEAGRVLIKRLPNAGTSKIGKEKFRDGSEHLVAEIYINQ